MLAYFLAAFSAIVSPASGGELRWYKSTSTTPVALRVDATPMCGVKLSSAEAIDIADVIRDVVDNDAPGQAIALVFGGSIRVQNVENGDVRLWTNGAPLLCGVWLLGALDEPDKVEDAFRQAGLF